ncbi:glycosyltransferase family 1 protein [Zopfia rhizophila CBS 207.26]|uniref:Glycosyltransferase family 1 protein n=1 Tax=Zopfia rhizophila CBS 207.26 TaxID=1314779 RepID=A0A6A6DGB7_9PEZI|nr:glycosyltransferase family 1 protein [Zopfia rhizophila CBS 207.26]
MADLPTAKILLVITGGGKSNAAPILEIARILHTRGHVIELATLAGNEHWARESGFITATHTLGPGIPKDVEEREYLAMSDWKNGRYTTDYSAMYRVRRFLASSWPAVYSSLSSIAGNKQIRPDLILADYCVDAVRDVQIRFGIPIVMHWSQMPTNMLHASYIPGIPGLQFEILTGEHASLWQRLLNDLLPLRLLGSAIRHERWQQKMRSAAGVSWRLPRVNKPDYLLLVNSFFGLEAAKDLPPLVVPVGPILSDDPAPLGPELKEFIGARPRILYISLGTHVLLRHDSLYKILTGVAKALGEGAFDGVIWAMGGLAQKQFDKSAILPTELGSENGTIGDLFAGVHPDVLLVAFAPQRAILEHSHTRVFLSHCGPASANEAAYHGVPVVGIGVYFDQLQCALRLRDAGVAIILDKTKFSADEVRTALRTITQDQGGSFRANCTRLRNIAHVASRRKFLAADLIEEVLADACPTASMGLRQRTPLHLQTADARMPRWKANAWDLKLIKLITVGFVVGVAYQIGKVGLQL